MTTEYVPLSSAFEEIHRRYFFFKTKNKGEMDMKNNDSLKRIKAMAEALAKIQKAQDEQKAMQATVSSSSAGAIWLRYPPSRSRYST